MYDTGCWNLTSFKPRTYLFYIVSTVGADVHQDNSNHDIDYVETK